MKPTASMTFIIRQFKVAGLFCLFIIVVSYFLFCTNRLKSKEGPFVRPSFLESAQRAELKKHLLLSEHSNEYAFQDILIDNFTSILNHHIRVASLSVRESNTRPGCDTNETIANSCDDGRCLRMEILDDAKERISQLIRPRELRLSSQNARSLQEMASKVSHLHDILLLTGASSNHFRESQALIKNLHEQIFPKLKNFTLIYYDLGLDASQRSRLEKYCKCTVLSFPFDQFPEFMGNLRCYSWKPTMIKAHINQANVLVWMDASVRFTNFPDFLALIERTRQRGFQMAGPSEMSPFRTVRSMYHFFGDEPCAYLQMGQLHATSGFFKRDLFVDRAILEPWVACALNKSCMCPDKVQQRNIENSEMARKWRGEGGDVIYGMVHRFDQSAVSLIIHKLFYKYYQWMTFSKLQFHVDYLRNDKIDYFPFHV